MTAKRCSPHIGTAIHGHPLAFSRAPRSLGMEDRRRTRCPSKQRGTKGISEPDPTRAAALPSSEEEARPADPPSRLRGARVLGFEGRECWASRGASVEKACPRTRKRLL